MTDSTDNERDWEAPKELYFYDDWLQQHTNGKILCGNNKYIRADLAPDPQDARVAALIKAASEQLLYMDMCNDKGDLERNLRAALAAFDKGGKDE